MKYDKEIDRTAIENLSPAEIKAYLINSYGTADIDDIIESLP